ncbi:GPR1/FUN34/yaaH [Penicillium canescens]|uniref:GPR1/FUN34/yaaH n=1 Tax=Penicillium canescens TaxID=5083 RepID=A0AAD6I161_PENCN|nr:GPR1/FUN34/yaaH [Penicillium canescens]KAJ5984765.1 GPR1/FUN34/yaaH [Penicillium canescens]KAJ6023627.1 GPR1/FUN34/yaaH [Penicillium canescens]KAJ6042925.1 GPR1/FUN34/yaaH [Penicillium canescens]KAJ6159354.1 GPR1/FUN34/yaaH [Penicillium canescens]
MLSEEISTVKGNEAMVSKPAQSIMKPGAYLANPAPLAMGGFATTFLSLSLAMMNFRGVFTQTIFMGDLCFVAGIGLLISAQWEMVRGNTFSYTVLSAYALFYGGYGVILIPSLGIADAYGGYTAEYHNALGFFVLIWAVFNLFFLLASCALNIVYIILFLGLELCLILDAASSFALGDGLVETSANLITAAGAFGFIASLAGYYSVLQSLCEDSLPFSVPMGDTSRAWKRWCKKTVKSEEDIV